MHYILSVTYLGVPIHFPHVAMELKREEKKTVVHQNVHKMPDDETFVANMSHHNGM
jgi:hypothetical protein